MTCETSGLAHLHKHNAVFTEEKDRKKRRKKKFHKKRLLDECDEITKPDHDSLPAMRPRKKCKKHKTAAPGSVKDRHAAAVASPAAASPPAAAAAAAAVVAPSWPFDPHPADHCETPLTAYRELAPALQRLAEAIAQSHSGEEPQRGAAASSPSSDSAAAELRIYDPYYCTGRVKEHLGSLGFSRVRKHKGARVPHTPD